MPYQALFVGARLARSKPSLHALRNPLAEMVRYRKRLKIPADGYLNDPEVCESTQTGDEPSDLSAVEGFVNVV